MAGPAESLQVTLLFGPQDSTGKADKAVCDAFDNAVADWVLELSPEALFTTARPLASHVASAAFDSLAVLHGALDGRDLTLFERAVLGRGCRDGAGLLVAAFLPLWTRLPASVVAVRGGTIAVVVGAEEGWREVPCVFATASKLQDGPAAPCVLITKSEESTLAGKQEPHGAARKDSAESKYVGNGSEIGESSIVDCGVRSFSSSVGPNASSHGSGRRRGSPATLGVPSPTLPSTIGEGKLRERSNWMVERESDVAAPIAIIFVDAGSTASEALCRVPQSAVGAVFVCGAAEMAAIEAVLAEPGSEMQQSQDSGILAADLSATHVQVVFVSPEHVEPLLGAVRAQLRWFPLDAEACEADVTVLPHTLSAGMGGVRAGSAIIAAKVASAATERDSEVAQLRKRLRELEMENAALRAATAPPPLLPPPSIGDLLRAVEEAMGMASENGADAYDRACRSVVARAVAGAPRSYRPEAVTTAAECARLAAARLQAYARRKAARLLHLEQAARQRRFRDGFRRFAGLRMAPSPAMRQPADEVRWNAALGQALGDAGWPCDTAGAAIGSPAPQWNGGVAQTLEGRSSVADRLLAPRWTGYSPSFLLPGRRQLPRC